MPENVALSAEPQAPQTVTRAHLIDWLHRLHATITEHRGYLTELDSAIGDGDHGANMQRGLDAVAEQLDNAPATIDELLKQVGMTLVTSVGGASGPLFGTFFLRAGVTAGAETEIDATTLAAALRAGLDGVSARGKASANDKTMLDAMIPAVEAFERAASDQAATPAQAAAAAAAAGRDATAPMLARKGRASYLGERSIGHIDPGAASTALLFESLAEALAN